jgi:hypothetical protein
MLLCKVTLKVKDVKFAMAFSAVRSFYMFLVLLYFGGLQTDGLTVMTKVIGSFRFLFQNAPKK